MRNPVGWSEPERSACAPVGPDSALDEQGPSFTQGQLYFSRSLPTGGGDLFVSVLTDVGFGRSLVASRQPRARREHRLR